MLAVVLQRIDQIREFVESRQKTLASVGICLMAAFVAYHVFTANNGIKVYFQKKAEHRTLQQEVDRLKGENAELAKRVNALKSDPQTIEKEAREQLKYTKPGEVVFVTPEQKPAQPPANATAHK